MTNALNKTMVWLGLAEERYEEPQVVRESETQPGDDEPTERPESTELDEPSPVRSVPRQQEFAGAEVTPLTRHRRVPRVVPSPPEDELRRIATVHPKTYNDAKTIGENFREGIPVILNLTELEDADAKRLVDFSAGLIFGLHGTIERVTNKVFLLSPSTVEVAHEAPTSEEERTPRTFFNQS